MEELKKIAQFFICFAYLVVSIGAVGYLAYIGQYVIMVCVMVIAALAAPSVWKMVKNIC